MTLQLLEQAALAFGHKLKTELAWETVAVAVEQGIAEEKALKIRMEEKSREFTERGSELYAKA